MWIDQEASFSRRFGQDLLRALFVLGVAVLTAGAASAQQNPFGFGSGVPWIFQSGSGSVPDDPGFDHFTRVMPMGTTTLHLYATAGQNPSGEGEQVCANPPGGGSPIGFLRP